MVRLGGIIKGGASAGLRFGSLIKIAFIFVFFFLIVVNAAVVGIQEKSIRPVLVDLGQRFTEPTLELEKESQEIIQRKGVYDESQGFFRGIISAIVIYSALFSALFMIVMWLIFFIWALGWLPFSGDNSRRFANFSLAILLFYILQVGWLVYANPDMGIVEAGELPFRAFSTFFKAIPHLLSPISGELQGSEIVENTI